MTDILKVAAVSMALASGLEAEAPPFGRQELIDAARLADEQLIADPMEQDADVAAMLQDPDAVQYTALIAWGQFPFNPANSQPRNWGGTLAVSPRGAIVVQQTVRFEGPTDNLLPRTDPREVPFTSATRPHFDALLVVIVDPEPTAGPLVVTLVTDNGPDFSAEMSALLAGPQSIVVDAEDNRIMGAAIEEVGEEPSPPELPLGAVQVSADGVDIGRCFGGDRCIEFTVTCPGIADAQGTLRVTGTGTAGTVILTTGSTGYGLFGNSPHEDLNDQFMNDLRGDGYLLVEVGWEGNGVWEGPGTSTSLACRSATAIDWIHGNLHGGGLFVAQGNSGGSAQIAFPLAYYGTNVLQLANLSGGPPPCPLSTAGSVNFDEQDQCVVDGDLFDETREPILFGAPRLDYANTEVRFFIGEDEPSSYIVDTANNYHDEITSNRSLQVVPNTGHQVARTQEGLDALLGAIRASAAAE